MIVHRRTCSRTRCCRLQVCAWWLKTDHIDTERYARWQATLDASERDHARRFFFEHDRREFVACHALLRSKLSSLASASPAEWTFSVDSYGKPRLAPEHGLPDLQFSISHTRGVVAVAVAWRHPVGIDVERIGASSDHQDLASRHFAAAEVELLRRTPAPERPRVFTRLWTLKEAYLKATGLGLSEPLDGFAFELDPVHVIFGPKVPDRPNAWRFATSFVGPRHILSLALRMPGEERLPISIEEVGAEDL